MAFTPEAQAEILAIVQGEVNKLGLAVLHGQLPSDPPGQPSAIGLTQIAAKLDALPTSGSDPALVAAVTELSDLLKSGTLALVATPPALDPAPIIPGVASSANPPAIDAPMMDAPMITQVNAVEGAA